MNRDLSLNTRVEEVRELQEPVRVIQFELADIKVHFDESLSSIINQFTIYEQLKNDGKDPESKNILRSQIVFLEGILDFYIHEMTKYCFYQMFLGNWVKTSKYKSFKVKMVKVEEALLAGDSKDWFFEYVSDEYSRTVFLSAENMVDQLNTIGIPFGDVMTSAFPERTENDSHKAGRRFIQALFDRRNAIAHQIDRSHDSAIQNDITREYVEDSINKVKAIVDAIHAIAITK